MQLSRWIKNISPQNRERKRERKKNIYFTGNFPRYTSSSNNVGDPITGPKRERERKRKSDS